LTRADVNLGKPKELLNVMDCIDAIALGDAREIFVIDTDWQICSFLDEFCM